jgi:hypothetical protein
MSAKHDVVLLKHHTHAGKDYAAGDVIPAKDLSPQAAAWLVSKKIGADPATLNKPAAAGGKKE